MTLKTSESKRRWKVWREQPHRGKWYLWRTTYGEWLFARDGMTPMKWAQKLTRGKTVQLTKAHTDCDRWFSKVAVVHPVLPSVCVCVWLFTHLEMFSRFFLNPGWFNEFPWPIRCKKSWWISNWEKRKSERPRQWDMFNLAYYNHRYEKTMSFHTHQRGMFRKPDNSRRRCRCHCWGQ